ncbi:hypothetical protein ABU614_18955 [Lysobacter firmicutimachus]|uniref:Lipoprotein n=1 Tax=Lysobacter firmicutimachus TaxID=1792846 RepID=A0AAU8MQ68_9GAMM
MKIDSLVPLLALAALGWALTACAAEPAGERAAAVSAASQAAQSPDAAAARTEPAVAMPATAAEIPAGFSSYASESIGGNRQCVVGAATDEDGMNPRPVVYLAETSGRPVWVRSLDLPADMHQSRATHCVGEGGALYVLLQSDTQAPQSLSQTVLHALKLDARSGATLAQAPLSVPGASGAVSAWVGEDPAGFAWRDAGLTVSGQYAHGEDRDRPQPFRLRVNGDLQP